MQISALHVVLGEAPELTTAVLPWVDGISANEFPADSTAIPKVLLSYPPPLWRMEKLNARFLSLPQS